MKPAFVFILLGTFLPSCTPAETQTAELAETTTFVLVRHAEKAGDSEDPDLSEEGRERAMKLAEVFANVKFDAIYSTPFIRTKETAAPVAGQNGLPVQEYNPRDFDTIIPDWMEKHTGQTILIVGHSNSTPTAANGILGRQYFIDKFEESDYGNLLFITVSNKNEQGLLHLRY